MGWDSNGDWHDDGYDNGGATIPWYNPETGQVEQLDNPDYHASPYEAAENEGRLPEFLDYVDTIYGLDPTGRQPTDAGVNLYDPSTWNWPADPENPNPPPGPRPPGPPRDPSPGDDVNRLFPRPNLPSGRGPGSASNMYPPPDPLKPWEGKFTAPTLEQATDSPGFQFRIGEGVKALQRSAAAKGTLLTGGTLKGLLRYTGDEASKEYTNVYNRAVGEYEGERTNFLNNEANRYNSQRSNRLDDFGIDSDYFQMGRQNRLDDFNIFNTMDTNYYNRLFSLAGLGNPGQLGGANFNYGNAASGLLTGIGNSSAAGQIGGANAWMNALGGVGNSAMLAALLRRPS